MWVLGSLRSNLGCSLGMRRRSWAKKSTWRRGNGERMAGRDGFLSIHGVARRFEASRFQKPIEKDHRISGRLAGSQPGGDAPQTSVEATPKLSGDREIGE